MGVILISLVTAFTEAGGGDQSTMEGAGEAVSMSLRFGRYMSWTA